MTGGRCAREALFRHRGSGLLLATSPLVWGAIVDPPPVWQLQVVGIVLVCAGASLRLASARRLGKHARVARCRVKRLVKEGPYSWTRNPLYLAALLMLAGMGLITSGHYASTAVAVGFVLLLYEAVARYEEDVLIKTHGSSGLQYVKEVPRWLPRPPRNIRSPTSDVSPLPWSEVCRREWRLIVWLPAGVALGLLSSTTRAREGLVAAAERMEQTAETPFTLLLALLAALAVGGLTLRTELSYRRRLRRRALLSTLSLDDSGDG
ncbi:MAG: hypothetical protein CMF76_00025 [Maricaulis sp.]|nr:hypothetical protein [Maricaulis sp.]